MDSGGERPFRKDSMPSAKANSKWWSRLVLTNFCKRLKAVLAKKGKCLTARQFKLHEIISVNQL